MKGIAFLQARYRCVVGGKIQGWSLGLRLTEGSKGPGFMHGFEGEGDV